MMEVDGYMMFEWSMYVDVVLHRKEMVISGLIRSPRSLLTFNVFASTQPYNHMTHVNLGILEKS